LAWLAITHSHPAWLVERWLDRFGFEATEAWVRYDNTPANVTVWPLAASASAPSALAHLEGDDTRFVPGGRVLSSGREALPLITDGVAYEASAAVGVAAGCVGRGRVLDACASPGGKSLAMRPYLPDDARLVANDVRARRVALLASTLARVPGDRIAIVRSDARHLPFDRSIDTLLIDAPCSGLGVLRREPDVRWRRAASDLPTMAALQRSLIEEALRALAPGGRLIYATCSSEPEENEDLVADLLDSEQGLARLDLRLEGLPGSMTPLLTDDGALRTWPHAHGLDAFYAVVIERR
jgi:16S rRNA (cytosine967-C5)-methyltransferase